MDLNRKFGAIEDGKIVYAPKSFEYKGVKYNLTNRAKLYREMGFFPVLSTKAPGENYDPFWEEENGVLLQRWEEKTE